jgi:tetratricopeptide (TPR) repeat protein
MNSYIFFVLLALSCANPNTPAPLIVDSIPATTPKSPVPQDKSDLAKKTLVKAQKLYEEDKHEEALALFEEVVKMDPKSAEAYYGIGTCYIQLGQHDKAIKAFKKLLSIEPSSSTAYYNLGLCYAAKNQWDLAIAQYKKAVADNPQNAPAHFELASAYFITKNLEKAKKHYDTAASLFGYKSPNGQQALRNAVKIELLLKTPGK